MPRTIHTSAIAFLALTIFLSPAAAQWQPNGSHVTSTPYQSNSILAPDGVGGVFIAMDDLTSYWASGLNQYAVRLHRLTERGVAAPGWPAAGIAIPRATSSDSYSGVIATNADGSVTLAIVGQSHLYATRYRGDGSLAPGWGPTPIPVAPGPGGQQSGWAIPTTNNANLFLWVNGSSIYLARLEADGALAPGWPSSGRVVLTTPNSTSLRDVKPDGSGGVWIAVDDVVGGLYERVYLQHVDATGTPAPGWPALGRSVTSVPSFSWSPTIAPDGMGGAFVAWSDAQTRPNEQDYSLNISSSDIYLQRLTSTGSAAPGWPANGLLVCDSPNPQWSSRLADDGHGGVFIDWLPSGIQGPFDHIQHVLGTGTVAPGWVFGGRRLPGSWQQTPPAEMAADGMSGLFLVARTLLAGYSQVVVQHMTASGTMDAPSDSTGLLMVASGTPLRDWQETQRIAPSLPGSAIACWNDGRVDASYPRESYAQRVNIDGPVATQASLIEQDAASDHVMLAWLVSDAAGFEGTVERRDETSDWSALGQVLPDGTGRVSFEDRTVIPGARYAYRLSWQAYGGAGHTAETWITVPAAARFALTGATPNPASRTSLTVSYSLAEPAAAMLSLYDLAGRCVATHAIAANAPGPQSVRMDEARSLNAGVYWLRLAQGSRQATTRIVLGE